MTRTVGAGTGAVDGGVNCSNRTGGAHGVSSSVLEIPFQELGRDRRTSYGVHVSKSLDGPWVAVPGVTGCNNPVSPHARHRRSILRFSQSGIGEGVSMKYHRPSRAPSRAPSIFICCCISSSVPSGGLSL